MVLGPRCAGCAPIGVGGLRSAPGVGDAVAAGEGAPRRASAFLSCPGPRGLFNKSFNSQKSLHIFTHSYPKLLRGVVVGRVHLAQTIQPPAEGVAGAHE